MRTPCKILRAMIANFQGMSSQQIMRVKLTPWWRIYRTDDRISSTRQNLRVPRPSGPLHPVRKESQLTLVKPRYGVFKVWNSGCRIRDAGFRVWGLTGEGLRRATGERRVGRCQRRMRVRVPQKRPLQLSRPG